MSSHGLMPPRRDSPSVDPEHALLRKAGLTDYEARAYRALLELGSATAADVADASRIPRTRIYAVLDGLLGDWVAVEPGRPKRYRARDPQECFQESRRRLDAEIAAGLPVLAARYHEREQRFAGALWVLEGEDAIFARVVQIVDRARSAVHLVAAPGIPLPDAVIDALLRAHRRGVALHVGAPPPAHAALARRGIAAREARLPVLVLVADGAQGLLCTRREGEALRGLWNPNPELARFTMALIAPVLEAA